MLLAPVQHLYENVAAVRRPCDASKVSVGAEIADLDVQSVPCLHVIYAEPEYFGFHSGHGIFQRNQSACPRTNVEERECRDIAFVFSVECEFRTVRRPECAGVYPEFVPAYCLAVHYVCVCIFRYRGDGSG